MKRACTAGAVARDGGGRLLEVVVSGLPTLNFTASPTPPGSPHIVLYLVRDPATRGTAVATRTVAVVDPCAAR